MRLFELTRPKGTFAGVRFSNESAKRIHDFAVKNGVPSPIPADELHATLLFSRNYLSDYNPVGEYKKPLTARPVGVKLWGDDNDTVVVLLDCPELVKRHEELMSQHKNATWDYEDYLPHVSLSYDAAGFDIGDIDYRSLGTLQIASEYAEDLDLDGEYE